MSKKTTTTTRTRVAKSKSSNELSNLHVKLVMGLLGFIFLCYLVSVGRDSLEPQPKIVNVIGPIENNISNTSLGKGDTFIYTIERNQGEVNIDTYKELIELQLQYRDGTWSRSKKWVTGYNHPFPFSSSNDVIKIKFTSLKDNTRLTVKQIQS
jgi:hypothetical protein